MLKVGRKRKEGEKAHKLDCLDLTEIHHVAKETKFKIDSIS